VLVTVLPLVICQSDQIKTSVNGSEVCVACAPGQRIAVNNGQSSCEPCPADTYEVGHQCQACPDGVICGSGTHLGTWALEPGRWRLSPSSTDIQRCERDASNDGSSRCIGGTIEAQGSSDDLCMEGHAGPMCMLCVTANESQHAGYFDRARRRCKDCPSDTGARIGALVGSVAGTVFLAYVLRCSWSAMVFGAGAKRRRTAWRSATSSYARLSSLFRSS